MAFSGPNMYNSLLKKWHFLDLICAIYSVTMKIEINKSNLSPQKVAFSRPNMFSTGSNDFNGLNP